MARRSMKRRRYESLYDNINILVFRRSMRGGGV
jgi:hypothetical protein